MKLFFKAAGLVLSLFLSGMAGAVSMGAADIGSALGQPLRVKIAIKTASKVEANSLSARLATPDTYRVTGVDYPFHLPALSFQLEKNTIPEEMVLTITSVKPVSDPFVRLLVEVNWSSGKLLREYTLLLDPPNYAVDQLFPTVVMPIEPVITNAPDLPPMDDTLPMETEAIAAEDGEASGKEPIGAAISMPEKVAVEPIAEVNGLAATTETGSSEATTADTPQMAAGEIPTEHQALSTPPILTKRGDTLATIAQRVKPPEVSLERMLLALYRANARAFDNKNMNQLKVGKVVRIPELEEINTITQSQAKKEVRIHVTDWNAYRQKLAAATQIAPAEAKPKQEVSGKISATVADKALDASKTAKEVVKLSKGEAPEEQVAAGGTAKSALSKQAQAEETAAQAKALKDDRERTALLEKTRKDVQRLEQLQAQQAGETAKSDDSVKPVPLDVLTKVPTESAVIAARPRPVLPPPVPVEEPSFIDSLLEVIPSLDEILGESLYQLAGVALLLVVGGLVWFNLRRNRYIKKKLRYSGNDDDNAGSAERFSVPATPSPETGDFTTIAPAVVAPVAAAAAISEDVDPVSEAELFLTFGRDEQAEEILKEALLKTPNNVPVLFKLLSIYTMRHDTSEFSKVALKIKDLGDAGDWDKVKAMGRKLEPANPVYGGSGIASTLDTVLMSAPPQVMFEVGGEKEAAPLAMDMDLGFGGLPTSNADFNSTQNMGAPPKLASLMDFDITASHNTVSGMSPSDILSTASDLNAGVFDVTASADPVIKQSAPAFDVSSTDTKKVDMGMEFTLDFPTPEPPKQVESAPLNTDLSSISLNMDMPFTAVPASAPIGEEAKGSGWHDVATKIDLAKAYREMGDGLSAKEILEEVLREGDEQQRAEASSLLQQV
ncbi:MAG: FimV/HubP family polar landmark protein [Candidatus Nitrotoga sp.]